MAHPAEAAELDGEQPAVAVKKYYLGAKTGTIKNSVGNLQENSSATSFLGGYLVGSDFAIELGYTNLGTADGGKAKISALELVAIANFPINQQFSLFGKLGMAKSTETLGPFKISRLAPTYALGGAFTLNPIFNLRFGWDRYSFGGDVIYISNQPVLADEGTSDVYSVAGIFKF